jgi:hypothetical protein
VRLALRLDAADVGQRVVVRRRLPDGRLTDVLGVLERWDDAAAVVRSRTGDATVVARADVVAGKRIPPPPVRRGPARP